MQLASSSTTPSSFGSPPYPTLLSRGSSSTMFTPAITASRVSPPPFITSTALLHALIPPLFRLALATAISRGRDCACTILAAGRAAAPRIAALRLNVRLAICAVLLSRVAPEGCRPDRCKASAEGRESLCHTKSRRVYSGSRALRSPPGTRLNPRLTRSHRTFPFPARVYRRLLPPVPLRTPQA